MAFVHGKDAAFLLDTSGTLDNISTYLTDVSFPETVETADVTTLGDSAKEYIVGLKDATISLSGKWDLTWDQLIDSTVGQAASLTFNYGPNGSAAPKVKYSGECYVTNYSISSGIGDAVSFSLDLQVTGAVTRGVFS